MLSLLFKKRVSIKVVDSTQNLFIRLYINEKYITQIRCVKESSSKIFIGDIDPYPLRKYENRGYGSAMMQELIKYASENGYSELYGNLSTVDEDHKDRLHHFYEKHGFEIQCYEEPVGEDYGRVQKILK